MKESFQRLIAWSKQHPYLAGVILLGIVVLAYLTIKRGGLSSSSVSYDVGAPETNATPDPGAALGSSDLSNLGTLPTLPANDSGGSDGGGAGGGFGGGGAGENGGGYSSFDMAMPDPMPLTGSYALSMGSPVSSVSSESLQSFSPREEVEPRRIQASASAGRLNTTPTGKPSPSGGVKGEKQQPTAARPDRTPAQVVNDKDNPNKHAASIGGGVKGEKQQPTAARPNRTPVIQPKPATRTPAEMVGKPKYFTGYYKGVVYAAGYPVRR